MNPNPPLVLAGDTNVSIDLAQDSEWVLDALSTIRSRRPACSLLVPPTVSEELAWLADHADALEERKAAHRFLRRHRSWGFQLLHEVPLGNFYVAKIAERFLQAGLLPAAEVNDAQILAESASLGCSILLTSDEHLRAIDFQRLSFELAALISSHQSSQRRAKLCASSSSKWNLIRRDQLTLVRNRFRSFWSVGIAKACAPA